MNETFHITPDNDEDGSSDLFDDTKKLGGKLIEGVKDVGKRTSDVIDTTIDVGIDYLNDAKEINESFDDIWDIYEVSQYFKENKESIEDIGLLDVILNTEAVNNQFISVNEQLEKAITSTDGLIAKNIQFNQVFLGSTVDKLTEVISILDGFTSRAMHSIAKHIKEDDDFSIGGLLRVLTPKQKEKNIVELSLTLKKTREHIQTLKGNLEQLIYPGLESKCSNRIINLGLEGTETIKDIEKHFKKGIDDLEESAKEKAWKLFKQEAMDKIGLG